MNPFGASSAFACLSVSAKQNSFATSCSDFRAALGALALLALLVIPFSARAQEPDDPAPSPAASPLVIADRAPAEIPAGYVVTPSGYFHPSCVKELAEGESLEEGGGVVRHADGMLEVIPDCEYPHYNARGEAAGPGVAEATSQFIQHSYIEAAGVSAATQYSELNVTWTVPPPPFSNDGQVLYFFPALDQTNPVISILQPVLEWYSGQWSIASWNCCVSGTTWHSTIVNVNAGDTIYGSMKSNCAGGALSCATWNITTTDKTSGSSTTLSNTPNNGQSFNWAFAGALEVYNISQCSDYPPNAGIAFSTVQLYDNKFNLISSPSWGMEYWDQGLSPQCSYGGTVAPTREVLDYGSAGTLGATLSAKAESGTSPLTVNFTATAMGSATGTINYSFWWNCADTDTSVTDVETQCGTVSSTCTGTATGFKCNGQSQNSYTTSHIYSSAGTYTAKVIIERGSAPPSEAQTIIQVNAPQPAATPTFTPASGSYNSAQSVTIKDTTANAIIYYTTNGTAPSTSSTKYTGAIAVSSAKVIEAIALAAGYLQSGVATTTYTIAPTMTTTAAGSITSSTAILYGTVNPNGTDTNIWFLISANSSMSGAVQSNSYDAGSGTSSAQVQCSVSGKSASTKYYYQVVGQNSAGTVKGSIQTFTTSASTKH
jgi:hypothetical protein